MSRLSTLVEKTLFPEPELSERQLSRILRARQVADVTGHYWRKTRTAIHIAFALAFIAILLPPIIIAILTSLDVITETQVGQLLQPLEGPIMSLVEAFQTLDPDAIGERIIASRAAIYALMIIVTIYLAVTMIIKGIAGTRIHARYDPVLAEWAESGSAAAAFDLAVKAQKRGADAWFHRWLNTAAEAGHYEAKRFMREQKEKH